MSVSEEMLMAYADGELGAEERAAIEAALAADPALRDRLAAQQGLRARISAAYDPILAEPIPEVLLAAARGGRRDAEVVDLGARRQARWSAREWGAMAASLAAGLVIAFGISSRDAAPFRVEGGEFAARGALARALDDQLAADMGGAARIGLSFKNKEGEYCRTFAADGVAGLACRAEEVWRIALLAPQAQAGEVRQAGADTPAAILAAVDEMIAGETLDAEAEARARAAGWRAEGR